MTGLAVDVVARRGGFALDVRMEVASGEVVAVLGRNGAGKSTLLSVLAGLVRPETGHIALAGRVLTDTGRRVHVPPHRRGVGLLAQDPLLFPHLSVLANVAFGPSCLGASRRQSEDAARHWLSEVDAVGLAGRRRWQLSGGQAQRVALARALAAEPDLLLLDEPFAALDVDAAPALRAMTRRVLRGASRTALLVTHDPLDALVLADRVIVLSEGRLVEQGPTRSVLARPRTRFSAGVAGLNLIAGTAGPHGLATPDGTRLAGLRQEPVTDGDPVVGVFAPSAVAVHVRRPHGSPRNVFPALVAGLEPHGDVIRLRVAATPGLDWVEGLAADVTPAAVADLALEPGTMVWLAVKATEVAVHPAPSRA